MHASTFEEAAELLMRWSVEGLDNKMAGEPDLSSPERLERDRRLTAPDPAWSHPMKQVVQARAKQQQALAVAQVVEATAWSKTVGRSSKQKYARLAHRSLRPP